MCSAADGRTYVSAQPQRACGAYLQAASFGRADIDPTVLPERTIDLQDVQPDVFEAALGAQLRGQGFDACALVMLGGPGAGTGQRAGFWARSVMAEALGTWAMELTHVLTGFDDLYPFGGNLGLYDEVASNGGSHPAAYTKAAIGWLDRDAIATSGGPRVFYRLHAVSLPQPPPPDAVTAVRVGGPAAPYLMIEARKRTDQFDARIPAEGVIAYRVQTDDPLGHAQNGQAPRSTGDDGREPGSNLVCQRRGRRLDHHPDQRLGARGAEQHPSPAGERGLLDLDRGKDVVVARPAAVGPDVDEDLREQRHGGGELGERPAGADDPVHHLQGREQAVAGRGVVAEHDVAALLPAEPVPAGQHRGQHVAVADRGLQHLDAGGPHGLEQPQVAHDRGDQDVAAGQAGLFTGQGQQPQHLIAGQDGPGGIDDDAAVGVAVVRDPEVGPVLDHRRGE